MNATLSKQAGVAAIEFAIVSALVFLTALFGVIEFGRLLWTWNAATEATRLGARLGVVCDMDDASIETQMKLRLPALNEGPGDIKIDYLPAGCTTATCQAVRVSLTGYEHAMMIPFVPLTLTLPPFTTTLRKEYMQSTNNPVCS